MTIVMHAYDWLALFGQYMMLSLLSISGAITTIPDMHRFLVQENGWLSNEQFTSSVAIAQASPGPNVLFVALMGWSVGLNTVGGSGAHAWLLGLFGLLVTMTGILLPSTTLTYLVTRWGQRNRERRSVRAFKQGLAPVVIGLLVATAWVLASGNSGGNASNWHLWLLTAVATILVWRTRLHILWILGAGALFGALGML